jgi:hypothetical protein
MLAAAIAKYGSTRPRTLLIVDLPLEIGAAGARGEKLAAPSRNVS